MTFTEKYLTYNNGSGELSEGAFRISASQFNKFMSRPHEWYREQVLGESGFTGNTSSVLGTIVHGIAAAIANKEDVDKQEIENYISKFEGDEDVDCSVVRDNYKQMAETLVNDYVLKNMPTEVEPFVKYELQPDYYPSGSIDAIQGGAKYYKYGNLKKVEITKEEYLRLQGTGTETEMEFVGGQMIVDYKTYNSKYKPRKIPMNYMHQLLVYAYICRKNGKHIDRVRLVYINRNIDGGLSEKTGKPLKSYPPEVTTITEQITDEDMDYIESLLNLCIETVQTAKQNPELTYLLFRDYRLKEINGK